MNQNQRAAFILAVLGFLPVACAGTVVYHSAQHYALSICFLIGIFAFGWLLCIFKR